MIDKLRLDTIGPQFPKYIFLFLVTSLFLRSHLLIMILFLALIFYLNQDTIQKLIDKHEDDTMVSIKRDDGVKNITVFHTSELRDIFNKLKSFRRYNPSNYRRGIKLWHMFQSECQELARTDILYGNHIFENAQTYLHKSIAEFEAIHLSIPEQGLTPTLKNNKNTSKILKENLSKMVHDLYRIGYKILYPISEKLNKEFYQRPDIYMNQIVIDNSYTRPANDINLHTLYD